MDHVAGSERVNNAGRSILYIGSSYIHAGYVEPIGDYRHRYSPIGALSEPLVGNGQKHAASVVAVDLLVRGRYLIERERIG